MRNQTIIQVSMVAVVLSAMACRGKPVPVEKTVTSSDAIQTSPAEVDAGKKGAIDEEPKQSCGGTRAKEEAAQRGRITLLEEPLLESKRRALLLSHIDALREAASKGETQRISEIVADTYSRMPPSIPETNESTEQLLQSTAMVRYHGYATCRSITDDDPGWCEGLDGKYSGGPMTCMLVHLIYRRITRDVYIDKKSCEEAIEAGPQIRGVETETLVAACKAITTFDASLCAFPEKSKMAALCVELSDRSGGQSGCGDIEEEDASWTECCEKLSYRVGLAMNANSHPRLSPETGALGGDADGCDRALLWGLFGDLGSMFHIEGLGTPLHEQNDSGDYTCNYEVQWTTQAVAGETSVQ